MNVLKEVTVGMECFNCKRCSQSPATVLGVGLTVYS